jgi:hypothetical protein
MPRSSVPAVHNFGERGLPNQPVVRNLAEVSLCEEASVAERRILSAAHEPPRRTQSDKVRSGGTTVTPAPTGALG